MVAIRVRRFPQVTNDFIQLFISPNTRHYPEQTSRNFTTSPWSIKPKASSSDYVLTVHETTTYPFLLSSGHLKIHHKPRLDGTAIMAPPPAAPTAPRSTHLAPTTHTSRRTQHPSAASSRSTSQMPASFGSQTVTATNSPSPEPELVLRLRGAHDTTTSTSRRRRIQWAEGTVDNEGLGRKKSKVCCIYHKEHPVGESSDESSSSSDDSESGGDDGSARPVGGKRKGRGHGHNHGDGDDCGHGKVRGAKRKPSPNAYEKMPKYDIKSLKQVDKTGT